MDIIWVSAAFIFGILVSRLQIPPLVGYLIAGISLSIWGYEPGDMLKELSHLGVIFLLFTVGLHIRLKNILAFEVIGVGITHLAISSALFTPLAIFFGYDLTASLIIGIVLGFSSTVLTAKTLERRNELGAYYGRIAIGILIIQDLVAIGIIAFTGGGVPSIWSLTLLALPLLRPLLRMILTLLRQEELMLLFGLVMAIGGAELFEWFNLSGELGAIAIGMLFATDEHAGSIEKKLWGIKEAFLVAFFLDIGLIGLPVSNDLGFIILVLMLLPFKAFLFFSLFMFFKLRARTGFLSTVTLTAYSEFTLIAGVVAAANDFIPQATVVVLGLITAISYTINAPLTIWEEKMWKKMEAFLLRFERDVKHPDRHTISLGSAEYLVVGMGDAGMAAYDELRSKDMKVVGMDIDPDRLEKNLQSNRRVIYGDIQDTDLWKDMDLSNIKSVIIAMGNKEVKRNATKTLRETGYDKSIYVLTMRDEEVQALRDVGASSVSIPIREAGQRLALLSMAEGDNVPSINVDVQSPDKESKNEVTND